ncbi:hypothetical protein QBC34DRAFT_420117 [Podospora aff. communis PSN243]|uniref:Uncharacterized protein n=1 Tax=Podospora aff. communis PSN243 TaxID=3040156 RepID=A0AAV9H755_9PEZI|nr:hypothetical protein QBC34DRAFT_420117 [Podospora aff. communis PSN243]
MPRNKRPRREAPEADANTIAGESPADLAHSISPVASSLSADQLADPRLLSLSLGRQAWSSGPLPYRALPEMTRGAAEVVQNAGRQPALGLRMSLMVENPAVLPAPDTTIVYDRDDTVDALNRAACRPTKQNIEALRSAIPDVKEIGELFAEEGHTPATVAVLSSVAVERLDQKYKATEAELEAVTTRLGALEASNIVEALATGFDSYTSGTGHGEARIRVVGRIDEVEKKNKSTQQEVARLVKENTLLKAEIESLKAAVETNARAHKLFPELASGKITFQKVVEDFARMGLN